MKVVLAVGTAPLRLALDLIVSHEPPVTAVDMTSEIEDLPR